MLVNILGNPVDLFLDSNGAPLQGGSIYIGQANTDPTNSTNQITVYQDQNLTIPLSQPIKTSNGHPWLNGSQIPVYFGIGVSSYSLAVLNAGGVVVLSLPSVSPFSLGGSAGGNMVVKEFVAGTDFTAGTTTQLTLASNFGSGTNLWVQFDGVEQHYPDDYTLNGVTLTFTNPIPVGTQKVYTKGGTTAPVNTPTNGSVTDVSVAAGSKLYNRITDLVTVTDYGAKGDNTTDNTTPFANAMLGASGPVIVPSGKQWKYGATTLFNRGIGIYDGQPASTSTSYNTFESHRYANSTIDTNQYANGSFKTEISATTTQQEIGVLSLMNIQGSTTNLQTHVGTYTQLNCYGNFSGFAEGYNSEIGNVDVTGAGTSVDNALIGFEADIKTKYAYTGIDSPHTRKTGYSAVAWGGGDCTEGFALYAAGGINGVPGNYTSGDWIYGMIMRQNSLNVASGIGIAIQSDHAQGITITGKSVANAISLSGASSAGNVGINIGSGYSVGIALSPNQPLQLNGAGNIQGLSYDSARSSINFSAAALEVSNHTTFPTATGIAGYLGMYVNGTQYKVPFYNV